MAKAKARSTTPKVTFFDPAKIKEAEFGLTVRGDCMAPEIKDGSHIVVHRDETPKAGDLAAIFFRPEFVRPGDLQCKVKRLVTNVPPFWRPGKPLAKGSNVAPALVVMDAKNRFYTYDLEHVVAVCKASLPDEKTKFSEDRKVPAAAVLKPGRRAA